MAYLSSLHHVIKTATASPYMPVLPFIAGVTYDSLTLTRIDRLADNLVLFFYVSLLGMLIILTGRTQLLPLHLPAHPIPPLHTFLVTLHHRAQPYFPLILQFLFGGLFSAYAVVYFQSASWDTTAIFLILIVLLLVLNEMFRNRLSNVQVLVTLYAFVILTFLTYFLPVLTGWMNTFMFLLGAALSALVVIRVVQLIYTNIPLTDPRIPYMTCLPALTLIAILVGFYFLNWIPPVPLSLKFGGAFHHIVKTEHGFALTFREGAWYQPWKRSDDIFYGEGPLYCFTAIFAPSSVETTIFHHWQYRPLSRNLGDSPAPLFTTDRIPITVSGGRANGYRSYTVKQHVPPGEWQVDVETQDGRLIGRIHFEVEPPLEDMAPLKTILY